MVLAILLIAFIIKKKKKEEYSPVVVVIKALIFGDMTCCIILSLYLRTCILGTYYRFLVTGVAKSRRGNHPLITEHAIITLIRVFYIGL